MKKFKPATIEVVKFNNNVICTSGFQCAVNECKANMCSLDCCLSPSSGPQYACNDYFPPIS